MIEPQNVLDFRILFESAPGLYLVLTSDFKIAAASDAYLTATMTKREDILGRGVFEVFPDMESEIFPRSREIQEVNRKLRAANDELERRVRERTEQLTEADRRKDAFLAMLAHELRNPLAPLRNALHVMGLCEVADPAIRQALEMMDRQLRHLARIVDDLVDVSRIMRGKIQLRTERLDLAMLVRTVVEDHRGIFQRAGVGLMVDSRPLPVWMTGDPIRLTQVLGNLLRNACKFTGAGGEVSVRLSLDTAGGKAAVAVRDTGVGIEPAMLPHLFETFAQADRSLDRSQGGLGLGLALVKGLAELHGGEVQATSAGPGRGAQFTLRLPVEPEPKALSNMPKRVRRTGKHLRILVVEDNRDSADSLRMLLQLHGHEVTVAYSGPEGVSTAEQWRPDVVLCDIGLPGLDGYGVAGRIRQNPLMAQARLIAVTGYGRDEDRRRSDEAGFNHHMVKPVDPAALERLLRGLELASPGP
ncbi:MAG TPA: ATP-binding protein [Pirellulales bacterium]|nr:ATP-binding protein [Pirellulales bacterium]